MEGLECVSHHHVFICYVLICDCPPCPFSSLSPVLGDLRLSDLREVRARESKWLRYIRGVVRLQSGKSPEVMSITADVLRRHGFEKESRLLAGRQSRPSYICLCYVTLHYIHKVSVLYRECLHKTVLFPLFLYFLWSASCTCHSSTQVSHLQALTVNIYP